MSFCCQVTGGDELYYDDSSPSDVTGASVPGIPFVWMGRNPHISWTLAPAAHRDTENLFDSDDQSSELHSSFDGTLTTAILILYMKYTTANFH